jgi:DNA-binding NtrC family response regulator
VLPEEIVEGAVPVREQSETPILPTASVAEAKRALIRDALRRTDGHQTPAAELLGLTQPYLARLIKNLGVRS